MPPMLPDMPPMLPDMPPMLPDMPPTLPSSYPDPETSYPNRLRNPFWSSPSAAPPLEPGAERPAAFAPPLPPTTVVVSR